MLHDFNKNLSDLRDYRQNVILHPQQWRSFAPPCALNWEYVKFGVPKENIPEQRGIYTFVVQFQDHHNAPFLFPIHGYVLYGGITGHDNPERTLRKRYYDYLLEKGKRIQIWSMLTKWKDDLFFHFSPIDDQADLAALELALNDAIIPPLVTKDFSAEVRELVRVLRTN